MFTLLQHELAASLVLDFENVPLLQITHFLQDVRHTVAQIVKLAYWYLEKLHVDVHTQT